MAATVAGPASARKRGGSARPWHTFATVAATGTRLAGDGAGTGLAQAGRCPSGGAVGQLRLQALVEERAREQNCADSQERERACYGAQVREVVEEDLPEADPEEREPAEAKCAHVAPEPDVEEREPEEAPQRAHVRVPALEVRVDAARGETLVQL